MIGVVGSTRFIGKYIVRALAAEGESVVWLVRDPAAARSQVGDGVDIRECDLTSLPADLPDLQCVVSASHIGFSSQVIALCTRTGAKHAVFVSSSLVHSRLRTEKVITARENEDTVRSSNLSWTILRPTMIYGDGDRNISMIRRQILNHRILPVVGSGQRLVQPVYAGDLALAISASVCTASARSACFEIGGPTAMSYSTMVDQIADSVGRNPLKVYVPVSLAYPIAWMSERWSATPRITRDRVRRMEEDRAFSIDAAEHALGFYPRSFADGLSADTT